MNKTTKKLLKTASWPEVFPYVERKLEGQWRYEHLRQFYPESFFKLNLEDQNKFLEKRRKDRNREKRGPDPGSVLEL